MEDIVFALSLNVTTLHRSQNVRELCSNDTWLQQFLTPSFIFQYPRGQQRYERYHVAGSSYVGQDGFEPRVNTKQGELVEPRGILFEINDAVVWQL